ncbi:MAG TPA: DUF2834 domain-containing protein [Anaerolineales bacterium]|nr:DUF2834 domain-containing protein [Anaerolineales bacterium]
MKTIYIVLCIVGLVLPYVFFIPFVAANGLDLGLFTEQLFANKISAFFGMDVIASSLVLWAFIYHETRKRSIPFWWLAIVANLTVGVSLGLPLFLLLREISAQQTKA